MTRGEEVAWAAGIFEGEGTVAFPLGKARGSLFNCPQVTVAMTDEDVIRRLHSVFGVGVVGFRPCQPPRQDQWRWRASGADAIGVAELILPFLMSRRSERLGNVVRSYYEQRAGNCEACGTPFIAQDPRKRCCSDRCSKRLSLHRARDLPTVTCPIPGCGTKLIRAGRHYRDQHGLSTSEVRERFPSAAVSVR